MKVTIRHVRMAEFCSRGARAWFIDHGIDWNQVIGEGVDIEVMRAFGDPLADRVVAAAEEEAKNGQGN